MGGEKCDECDKRKDYLVQFMEDGDEGDNPWMREYIYCCSHKLKRVCKNGNFGKGLGDSIIDMGTRDLYNDVEAALRREGFVYTISPESYLEWSLLEDERQAVF